MVTWESVAAFGITLPDVEESTWHGTPALKVRGKGFLRLRPEDGAILARLDQYFDVDAELKELITEAWRMAEAKTSGSEQ